MQPQPPVAARPAVRIRGGALTGWAVFYMFALALFGAMTDRRDQARVAGRDLLRDVMSQRLHVPPPQDADR